MGSGKRSLQQYESGYPTEEPDARLQRPKKVKHHRESRNSNDHVNGNQLAPHEASKQAKDTSKTAMPISTSRPPLNSRRDLNKVSLLEKLPSYLTRGLPRLPAISEAVAAQVFTHVDAHEGSKQSKLHTSYDRLEFLGDSYIHLMSTRLVFAKYPSFSAGRLSQQREILVRNSTLALYTRAYELDRRIIWPRSMPGGDIRGCLDSTLPQREYEIRLREEQEKKVKILGDIFEAYVAGAITSSSNGEAEGLRIVQEWLYSLWEATLNARVEVEAEVADVQAKLRLAQRLMSPGISLDYREERKVELVKHEGKQWFYVAVYLTGWNRTNERLGCGKGLSKQDAGQKAAADALDNPIIEELAQMKSVHDAERKRAREAAA